MRIFILALLILSCGCQDNVVEGLSDDLGYVVFETESFNYAWGTTIIVKMIDKNGRVLSYDSGKTLSIMYITEDEYYDKETLLKKHRSLNVCINTVDADSLRWAQELASKVSVSSYSDTTRIGADMGSIQYSVYLFDARVKKYRKVVLSLEGNPSFHNTSASAESVLRWMRQY